MKTRLQNNLRCFLRLCLMLAVATVGMNVSASTGACQDADTKKEAAKKSEKNKSDSDEPPKPSEKKKPSRITAIVGGNIHTVSGPVIREGTILVQDGKILEVGQSVTVPDDAKVIDASGKTITPGFVAISMRGIGIRTLPTGKEKLADALDPFDRNMKYSLGVGITTGCIELSSGRGGRGRRRAREGEPEEMFLGFERPVQEFVTEAMLDYGDQDTSLCPCCGLPVLPTEPITPTPPTREQARKMAVIKMSYGNLDSMLTKESVFYSPSPGALNGALNRHNWRRDIKKARESMKEKEKEAAEKEKKTSTAKSSKTPASKTKKPAASKKPATKVKPELISLLKRETAMRVRANSVDEIRDMVDLANELHYDIVIEGGIEAWVLAEELGASDVSVIYTPRQRREAQRDRKDDSGSFIESTGIFEEAGVPFAIATLSNSISTGGLAGRDLTSLPLEAAFAVRGGADERTALEALTLTPAKMMGLDDQIGSIEAGKDADILILNGSPLDYRTYVEQAIVAGKLAYDRSEDRVYPVYDRK